MEALRAHGVTSVAIISDSQAAIRRTVHVDPGQGQQLARAIDEHARAGSKRPVPMPGVKSLTAGSYRLKSGHAPTGTYLKRFGHRENDNCWWCREGTLQTREHLLRDCSRWKHQQNALWTAVGKDTGWKVGRCRHVQISEQFSMDICDQAVMDCLAATDFGKFPPRQAEEPGLEQNGQEEHESGCLERGRSLFSLISFVLCGLNLFYFSFHLSKGTMGSRWELRHLAGSPGGRGGV